MATDRPASRGRGFARGDVATNIRARAYGRFPVEHGEAAVDAPGDDCVAVQHERVAGDAPVDPEITPAHVHRAVHTAVDQGRTVGGHRWSVDGLASRHDKTAGHADAAVLLVSAVLGAGGLHARQQEEEDNCCRREDSTAHAAIVTLGYARFGDARRAYGCGDVTDVWSPSSEASTWEPNASGAGPLSAMPSGRLRARHAR